MMYLYNHPSKFLGPPIVSTVDPSPCNFPIIIIWPVQSTFFSRLQGFNNALHWRSGETIRHVHGECHMGSWPKGQLLPIQTPRHWSCGSHWPPMTMEQSTAGRSVPVKAPVQVVHRWWVYYDCAHWERMQKTSSGDSTTTGCWVYSSHSANRWDRTSSRSSLPEQHISRIKHLPGSFVHVFGGAAKEQN